MNCPDCHITMHTFNSRHRDIVNVRWRRWKCDKCNKRFSSYEFLAPITLESLTDKLKILKLIRPEEDK